MSELTEFLLAEDEDKWITINGSHVKINGNGDVVEGAEGKIGNTPPKKKGVKLTPNEKSAISSYSGDNFLKINSQLRSGDKSDPDVSRLDSAIDKGELGGETLYRGISRDDAKKLFPNGEIKKGMTVSDPSFLSTSTEKKIAGMFSIGGVMLEIETQPGAKGLDVTNLSSNKHESETLLPRNAKLEVVSIHPGKSPGQPVTVKMKYAKDSAGMANDSAFAFDRASVRSYDADGMMHVALTPISKANVCVYYGKEIPDAEALGLIPEKAYRLLRDPEELRKAAPTFNNKPVLNQHIGVMVAEPPKEAIIGSTGESAEFDDTYLKNSMVVWDLDSIMGIETERQKEISSSYRYRLDLTPGVYEGEAYDGVMRDIVCNHVAIVPSGRVGPDVFVYDSKPSIGKTLMSKLEKFWAYILPKLASDADPDEVKKEVTKVIKDEATQAERDNESEAERLAREEKEVKERKERERKDRERDQRQANDSETEEEKKEREAKERAAKNEADNKEKEKMANDNKLAMDAAIKGVEARFQALRQAERDVRPVVGELACDSAEEFYRTALKQMGCEDHATLPEGALRSVFNALAKAPAMAQDSAPHHLSGDTKSDVLKMIRGGKA
ncbi:DUF2213 domain-containing protein [Phytobacter diazotrophicus]|uniref:DUF2213 domain-containing protein n=1 Tax=Phytobacter diazotrophicus TaxID=395631 RepID=UPI002FF06ED5